MPLNNISERPHFFVKGTFKPYYLTRFYEKYLSQYNQAISSISQNHSRINDQLLCGHCTCLSLDTGSGQLESHH